MNGFSYEMISEKDQMIFKIKDQIMIYDHEIDKAQRHLESAEERYMHLVNEMKIFGVYFCLIVFLPLAFLLFSNVDSAYTGGGMIFGVVLLAILGAACGVYIISFPLMLIQAIRTYRVYCLNKDESPRDFVPPAPIDKHMLRRRNTALSQEEDIQVEKQKLLWVLDKYYTYKDTLNQMIEDVKASPEPVDTKQILRKLNSFEVYEEVGVAPIHAKDKDHSTNFLGMGLYSGLLLAGAFVVIVAAIYIITNN